VSNTIPRELASRIVWFCTRLNVQAGETVIEKGSPGDELFIITRGQFRVHDDSAGEDFVLAMLNRGDIFGEMTFIDRTERSASVTAVGAGSILRMGSAEYGAMLDKDPRTAVEFMRFLSSIVCRRLRMANDALLQVAYGDQGLDTSEDSTLKKAIANMHEAVRMELEGT
jgi:CRP-like cAMP-binding protein